MSTSDIPLWQPSQQQISGTLLTRFRSASEQRWGRSLATSDYAALHAWSVEHPEEFWSSVWLFAGIRGEMGNRVVVDSGRMPGSSWFPDARLNFAENLLKHRDESDALVFWGEDRVRRRMSRRELHQRVAQLSAAMRAMGVIAGDRVAAYVANVPETLIAMLATASIGAIFTSASPDFGVQGVLDRFGQTQPKVLFATDGYWYNGRLNDSLAKLSQVVDGLPSLERVVVVPYVHGQFDLGKIAHSVSLADFIAPFLDADEVEFAQLPFNHPLYIMYSSGTTGIPKCIVHGAGGTLLQHVKEHQLHGDVRPGDRLFYFTTCGWMMWNWLMSGLASGATLLLYDGAPTLADGRLLFDYADAERMTHFGTSAKFLDAISKKLLKPSETHALSDLRVMFSTGSPLVAEGFDYVHDRIKSSLQLASISGGTDIISCFVLGNPNAPVYRGEIQCAGLGMDVKVYDDDGRPIRGSKGELVCTKPFPSMPLGFWNDASGEKYRAAYFERFPGVWCHGDFAEQTTHGGFIIYGRSDATLNPGGVRIGTAEIYRQVESLPEIVESLVIGQDWPPVTDGGSAEDVRVVLFVKLMDGVELNEALIARIRLVIRENTTPRHVPARILQVGDIPRTKSGKIVELAVRSIVHGRPVKNIEALANPEALDFFRNRAELRS